MVKNDIVQSVIEKQKKDLEKYKTIDVTKHEECNIDLGYLLCDDPNEVDTNTLKADKEEFIANLTRENVQLIVNELWQQPVERVEEIIVAKLPDPKIRLPRSRKIPDAPLMTKWQKFAKEKGIKKKKVEKKVFDSELGKWVPSYGYRKAEAERQKEWVLEVPKTSDPMEDQFQKKKDLRSEKVAKNEIQRMKNIARAKKEVIPRAGYAGVQAASSRDLETAAVIAKASTASVGKFQNKLPKEKPAKKMGINDLIPGAKRKASHISSEPEKDRDISLINSILNKKPKLDVDKAVQIHKREKRINNEEGEGSSGKPSKKGKKKQKHGNAKRKLGASRKRSRK